MTISIHFSQLLLTQTLLVLCSVSVSCFQQQHYHQQPASWRRLCPRLVGGIRSTSSSSSSSSSSSVESKNSDLESMSPLSQTPDMKAYAKGYQTVFQELPYKLCQPSFGQLPKDLVGTYFRCGPAMFSAGSIIPPRTSIIKPKRPPVPDGQDPSRMVTHPFEADGAIVAVTLSGGITSSSSSEDESNDSNTATVRFRYVRTTGFTNERKRGERLYKAMDSTRLLGPAAGGRLGNDLTLPLFRHHLQPGLNKNRKNTSNTRVIYWARRLLTLWEGGLPYKLDALALSTEGKSKLGGVLLEEDPFGAKLVVDPIQNRAILYRNKLDATSSELTIFEFDSNFKLVGGVGGGGGGGGNKVTTKLPGLALLSDFSATSHYTIFLQPAVSVNPMQFIVNKEPGKVVTVDVNKPATLHLIPRIGSSKPTRSISVPVVAGSVLAEANWQFCNAYEDDNSDRIVLDVIRSDATDATASSRPWDASRPWPWVTSLDDFAQQVNKQSLWRYIVDIPSGTVQQYPLMSKNVHCGFGVINPAFSTRQHRFVYMAVGSQENKASPLQGIGRFDCETRQLDTWMPQNYEFCGEPMYAPRHYSADEKTATSFTPQEDDGYILSILFNGKTVESELVVLRASDLSSGPVARVPFGLAIPHGLFGCFSAEATWSPDEIQRRAKLADKMESRGSMWNEVKSDFSGLGLRLDDIEEILGI